MWVIKKANKQILLRVSLKLLMLCGLGIGSFTLQVSQPQGLHILSALAQTKETQHQQGNNPSNQVHASGKEADSSLWFWDRYAPPKSISSYGHRLDWLFAYTSWVAFAFFVIMVVLLGGFLWFYRERPGHKAYYTHGKATKSEKWAPKVLDIAVFVTLDLVLIGSSYLHTRDFIWKYPQGPDVVKVQVMPQQWVWNFRYAGLDGIFGTEDDITTINDMRVPKGKPVMVQVKSKDVIHGFFITNVRAQIDAIPGLVTKFWFDANEVGDYEISCAHLCGTAHYKMKGFLKVMEESDYDHWYREMSEWAKAAYDPNDPSIRWGWNWALNDSAPTQTR
jgi:cytochrome c oxidase subunit 2